MQYLRYHIDIAVPLAEDKEGKLSIKERVEAANAKAAATTSLAVAEKAAVPLTTFDLIEAAVAQLVALGATVNAGKENQEAPVASRHICRHEEGLSCIEESIIEGKSL